MEFLINVFIETDTGKSMNIPINGVWNTVTCKKLQHISML
jgi:hypothetical protein